jgi:hypothetical protein
LQDRAGGRIDDDEFAGFARGDEQPAIRREGEALRTKARKFDLNTNGRDRLIHGQNDFASFPADGLATGGCAETGGCERKQKKQRLHCGKGMEERPESNSEPAPNSGNQLPAHDNRITMSCMKTSLLQIRVEPDLKAIIEQAVEQTGLSKSEVLRQGLRKGVPQVAQALGRGRKRTLLDALRELKGLEVPERHYPMKRRA